MFVKVISNFVSSRMHMPIYLNLWDVCTVQRLWNVTCQIDVLIYGSSVNNRFTGCKFDQCVTLVQSRLIISRGRRRKWTFTIWVMTHVCCLYHSPLSIFPERTLKSMSFCKQCMCPQSALVDVIFKPCTRGINVFFLCLTGGKKMKIHEF